MAWDWVKAYSGFHTSAPAGGDSWGVVLLATDAQKPNSVLPCHTFHT